ncbi:hypothetical protein PIB30_080876 [Stylosanthes scabra]|uniref:Uncharacterized protein n=1 Tax=Stylosanthes scabra TaxID=79078 RepID=A0ABU6VQ23_9FABA|nr:hypothetical protein [Stylosanthes scabra]
MEIWYTYENDEMKYYMNDGLGRLNRFVANLDGVAPRDGLREVSHVSETHNGETYPVNRASDNVGLRNIVLFVIAFGYLITCLLVTLKVKTMGTKVIFYEELADDMSETWDVFDSIFRDKLRIRAYPSTEPFRHPVQSIHFDPDFPYDYPISSMHPDGGILHPSPPPEPY